MKTKICWFISLMMFPVIVQSQEVAYYINGKAENEFNANSDKIESITARVVLPEVSERCDKVEFNFCKAGVTEYNMAYTIRYKDEMYPFGCDTLYFDILKATDSKFKYSQKGYYDSDFPGLDWTAIAENRQELSTFTIKAIGFEEEGTKDVWKHKYGCSGCSRSCGGHMEAEKVYGEGALLTYKNRLNVYQDSSYLAANREVLRQQEEKNKMKMKKAKRKRFLTSFIYGTVGLGAAALIVRWIRNSNGN